MNIENITKLKGILDLLIENESRVNEAKPIHYWYPLSLATYGTEEILEALDAMCSFRTSMAEKTLRFERLFSNYQGCADSVMVNSGSSADLLMCLLLTNPLKPILKKDDEILVPVVTWPTQIWSAIMANLKVKLVDVDPETLNVDLDDLEASITPQTKALFLVHLMGNPCDMDRIEEIAKRHDLVIIEDCCEAMGATWCGIKVGNFGIAGAFSFFFSHHLTTMEGGMICVRNFEDAEHLKILRAHGWIRNVESSSYSIDKKTDIDPRYGFVNWGLNVRPTEVQAGFGIRQIEKAKAFAEQRSVFYNQFSEFINGTEGLLSLPKVASKAKPSWLAIPIMVNKNASFNKSDITSFLEKQGVETRPIVAGNIVHHPVSALFPEFKQRQFSGADEIHNRGFYIGLSPMQTDTNMDRLITVFKDFLKDRQ